MNIKDNIIPYRQFLLVLTELIVLTLISMILALIYPGAFTAAVILLIAVVNSFMVLRFFMYLGFENRLLNILLVCIVLLISLVILVNIAGHL